MLESMTMRGKIKMAVHRGKKVLTASSKKPSNMTPLTPMTMMMRIDSTTLTSSSTSKDNQFMSISLKMIPVILYHP